VTDQHYERLEPLLPPERPPKGSQGGRPCVSHRRTSNGLVGLDRTGAPWRAIPARSGPWSTRASRFYRWREHGIWQRIVDAVPEQADEEGLLDGEIHSVDGTVIRAHQPAAGAAGSDAESEALGRAQGGFSTKVHVRAEGLGKPMTFVLTPGQRHEATAFEQLPSFPPK
jgi:transposase